MIAGAVIGGVIGLAIILGLILFFVIKRRRSRRTLEIPSTFGESSTGPAEMHGGGYVQELGPGTMAYKSHAVEVEQPPVELAAHDMRRDYGQGPS